MRYGLGALAPGGGALVAILKSFFDASFTMPSGITSIGGYLGAAEEWDRVGEEWSENLDYWHLEEFHLVDVVNQLGRERGNLCALTFARILSASKLHGIGVAVDDRDWNEINDAGGFGGLYPDCYHFAADMLFGVLDEQMRLELPGDLVSIVFDKDMGDQRQILAMYDAYESRFSKHFGGFAVGNRKLYPSIQCADLAAGTWRKDWLASTFGGDGPYMQISMSLSSAFRGAAWSKETMKIYNSVLSKNAAVAK